MDVDPIFLMAWIKELETEVARIQKLLGCVGDPVVKHRMKGRLDTAKQRVEVVYSLIYSDIEKGLAA